MSASNRGISHVWLVLELAHSLRSPGFMGDSYNEVTNTCRMKSCGLLHPFFGSACCEAAGNAFTSLGKQNGSEK